MWNTPATKLKCDNHPFPTLHRYIFKNKMVPHGSTVGRGTQAVSGTLFVADKIKKINMNKPQ